MGKKKQTYFAIRLFLTWVITLKKKAFKSFEKHTSARLGGVEGGGGGTPSAGLTRHAGKSVGYSTGRQ